MVQTINKNLLLHKKRISKNLKKIFLLFIEPKQTLMATRRYHNFDLAFQHRAERLVRQELELDNSYTDYSCRYFWKFQSRLLYDAGDVPEDILFFAGVFGYRIGVRNFRGRMVLRKIWACYNSPGKHSLVCAAGAGCFTCYRSGADFQFAQSREKRIHAIWPG